MPQEKAFVAICRINMYFSSYIDWTSKSNLMYKRVIKMIVTSKHNQDEIVKKTNILKGSPWGYCICKKTFTPSYCTRE